MSNILVTNFNSGEVSPEIDARKDIAKYTGACRILDNMIPDPYGNATRRPGTEFLVVSNGDGTYTDGGGNPLPALDYPQLQDILENDVTNILDNIFDDIEVSDPQGSTSINNEVELLAMTKGGSFFLTTDITITGNHTPLFDPGDGFTGILDGRGFKITYVLNGGGQDRSQGFMAEIGDGALIQNLLIDATLTAAGNNTGILAGLILAIPNGADIKNVHITGSINIVNTWPTDNPQGNQRPDAIGGMVGTAAGSDAGNRVNFSDCSATVDITIVSVQNNGFINGLSGFGGGDNMDWCSFTDCHYRGTIDLTAGVINRSQDIGGFIGDISNSIFTKCSANITLLGNDDVFAGFAGKDVEANVFDRCFSIGNLSSIGTNIGGHAGGFTPRPNEDSLFSDESTYTNCYSKCSIAWTRGFSDIGGFSGDIENSNSTIDNCYAIGALTSSDDTGGFSSGFEGGTITDCFWDTQTTGIATSSGGTGKTTALMKTESTYTNWDFDTIWVMPIL